MMSLSPNSNRWKEMSKYIDQLRDWAVSTYHQGLRSPELKYFETFSDGRGCWVTFTPDGAMGHLIIWDTDEYEMEIGSTTDIDDTMARHGVFTSEDELANKLGALLDFLERHTTPGRSADLPCES